MKPKQAREIAEDLGWDIEYEIKEKVGFGVIKSNEEFKARVVIIGFPHSNVNTEIWYKCFDKRMNHSIDPYSIPYRAMLAEIEKLKQLIKQHKPNTGRPTTKRIRSMRPERIERLKSESRLYNINVEKFYLTNNQGKPDYLIRRNVIKRMNIVKWKLFGK